MPSIDAAGGDSTPSATATLRGKFVRALTSEADAYHVHSAQFGLFHALSRTGAAARLRPGIGGALQRHRIRFVSSPAVGAFGEMRVVNHFVCTSSMHSCDGFDMTNERDMAAT